MNMAFLIQPRRIDKEGRINEMINVARDVISRMQAQATAATKDSRFSIDSVIPFTSCPLQAWFFLSIA